MHEHSRVDRPPPYPTQATRVVLDARVVTGTGGGPDKTILNSPRFLKEVGYHNPCAYLYPPNDPGYQAIAQMAEALGAPLISIPDRGPFDWRVVRSLARICRKERVAIWHGHDYKSNALGLLLNRFWPMRMVTTVHGWGVHGGRTPLYYAVDRFCLKRYEIVLCVSDSLYEACIKFGVPKDRCVLIENGVDTDHFRRRRTTAKAKRELGIPANRVVIGAVRRLSAEKGYDLLIRAVDRLVASERDIQLLIVGEGDQRPGLEGLIRELNLGDRVRLAGFQRDAIPFFEAMDLFALSSLREGLPNVVLEAMALEVPVVATRIAGVPRLIRDGENGLLVSPGSVEALTEALEPLVDDSVRRAQLAAAGRTTVETHHGFAARMDKIRGIYDRLLDAPPPAIGTGDRLETS